MNIRKNILLCALIFFVTISVQAAIQLPALVSDGMVLQRDTEVKIWGWAEKNEKIHVQFLNSVYRTVSNKNGEWEIHLKDLSPGGPYTMVIKGSQIIIIHNILVGDIWVCSGQSNMNYKLSNARSIYEDDIAQSSNPNIRQFEVPEVPNFHGPQDNIGSGQWVSANPQSVVNFSAVSYFFASELYKKYKIPIGLIHSSLSGSPAQAWISKDAIKEFPHYYDEAVMYEDDELIHKITTEEQARGNDWHKTALDNDEGFKFDNSWFHPSANTRNWDTMMVPGYWAKEPIGNTHGIMWLRKDVQIPAGIDGQPAILKMGRIVNADSVYINGKYIGSTGHQWARRNYEIPTGNLKAGTNTIVVRIVNHKGSGGFIQGYSYEIVSGDQKVDISGQWQYRLGTAMDELPPSTVINWKATGLFNGMIAPLKKYKIKGVIWYQGEGNAGKAKEYASLFPCLIGDWRKNWDQGDFPFLFVQLANFLQPSENPSPSNWAMLRESQRKTLMLPNTGMAVAIDIGEANDVHPMNKKDVGYRLALEAQRVAYGDKDVVSSGPMYTSMETDGNKIILSFETFGSSLRIRDDGELQHFAIAGDDKRFVWAKAEIENNHIIVWHPEINNPIAVRYAWANNPESCNLINKEGLPASPFRTDDWDR